MSDKDLYSDLLKEREKAAEDTYFESQDQELIATMKRRIGRAEERRKLAEAAHTDDTDIIEVLDELGYTAETLPVLFFMPVLEKLWSEGEIDSRKRKIIEDLAHNWGMPRGGPAFEKLSAMLSEKPSPEVRQVNLLAIKALLASTSDEDRKATEDDILSHSRMIAKAGRGLFGLENIPKLAQESIEQFFEDLGLRPDTKD